MKTISHKQSRRNSARRRRKVKARHARGRRWGTGPKPMFGSGRVRYEIGARINAMSYGGIGVVRRLVSKLGLAGEINRRLALLKRHLPYHESDHVLNIAYNMLCGGARLEDLGALRNNAAYMDALGAEVIPSPTAAGDFTRRFGEADVIELQECINAVRPRLWRGRGRDLLGPVAPSSTWTGRWRPRWARRRTASTCPTRGCGATTRSSSRWPTPARCSTSSTGRATR